MVNRRAHFFARSKEETACHRCPFSALVSHLNSKCAFPRPGRGGDTGHAKPVHQASPLDRGRGQSAVLIRALATELGPHGLLRFAARSDRTKGTEAGPLSFDGCCFFRRVDKIASHPPHLKRDLDFAQGGSAHL